MKKVLLIFLMSLLFCGVVTASSINGDYKGNPIVKVTSNGKLLEVDEVPAQIYDGHTVVPISLLRQLGASVTWDTYSYTVNVEINNTTNQSEYENFIKVAANQYNDIIKNVSIDILPNGTYLHILYSPPLGQTFDKSANNLFEFAGLSSLIKSKIDGTIIDIVSGNGDNVDVRYKIKSKDSEDYANNKLTRTQFFQKWDQTINK